MQPSKPPAPQFLWELWGILGGFEPTKSRIQEGRSFVLGWEVELPVDDGRDEDEAVAKGRGADGASLPGNFPSESIKGRLSRSLGMVCWCFHSSALLRTDFWCLILLQPLPCCRLLK